MTNSRNLTKDTFMTRPPTLTRVTRFGFVNAYLVVEEDGLTLIDTTIGKGGAQAILAAAERLERPIVRIALTHAHGDHVGGLDHLAPTLPDAEVLISARDARLLGKDMTPDSGEPADAKMRGGYPGTATRPTGLLEPGQRVGSLEVIAAPGHTPGHVAFLDQRDGGTLIAGDAFKSLGGVATAASRSWRFPLVHMATWHRPTALESARSLQALEPRRLAVGHGRVVEAPVVAMDAAIARGAQG
jgi:glyoxylase-like metal-dependent hydrolase (beta-lactamase superfamily II)